MVKPAAISIRRLMPHRRTGSDGSENFEESSADEHDLRFRSDSFKQQVSQTWTPQTKVKPATPPRGIRKAGARVPSPLPHISSRTAGTSPETSDPFRAGNKKAAAVLGLPPRNLPVPAPKRPARPSNGHLGLDESVPPRSPRPLKRSDSPQQSQGLRPESPMPPHGLRPESPLPLFNLNDSRPASPRPSGSLGDIRSESPRPFVSLDASRMEQSSRQEERELPAPPPFEEGKDWSDNVMQLIQETDQAFKAVGSALADAKLASYSFDRTQSPTPPPSAPLAPSKKELPPLPKSSFELQDGDRPGSSSAEVPIFIETPPEPSAIEAHAASLPRSITPSPRKVSTPEPSPSVTSTPNTTAPTPTKPASPTSKNALGPKITKAKRNNRWPGMAARLGFPDNVANIFTGQRFKKMEVEEMLTTDQIKELKKVREDTQKLADKQAKQRSSVESQRSASPDRKGSSQESVAELPVQPSSSESEYEEEEYEEPFEEWSRKSHEEAVAARPVTQFPPRKASRLASVPQLPPVTVADEEAKEAPATEAEAEVETEENKEAESVCAEQQLIDSLTSEEDDRYFYLKSSPYTMTQPAFKHGKITLSKVEVNKVKMTVDDTLDWTAFQMAILGGAGDLMSDLYDDDDEVEGELVDDISNWFDTLGFESFGELVGADSRSARDSAQSVSSDSSLSSMEADMDMRMPMGGESPTSFWHETVEMPLDTNKFLRSSGLKRWSAVPESRPKVPSHTRDSSLPTSPLMPLVVGGVGADSVIDESVADGTVPMGYNLGHDLGDFLRWEAEQMFGSGYYGAPRA
jgi:hypothetical protein